MFNRKRQIIMMLDDNQANLNMGKNMLKDFYEVYALPSVERLFKFLETVTPDLILLDVAMPTMSGFDVIKILKADVRYTDIPVIFLTSKMEEADQLEGLKLGAFDYVTKPFSAPILQKRIENQLMIKAQKTELKNLNGNLLQMVKEKTIEVVELQNLLISSMAEIIEFRDTFTGKHIANTQKYVELLVNYLIENNIYQEEIMGWENIDNMILSTQLHDIGKIFISDLILNKPGRLTPEEFDIMKTHVPRGIEAIKKMKEKGAPKDFLDSAEIVAATHHERWDGKGYPAGLKGEEIPLLGRLMAVADVYDALTSARPYKEPFSAGDSAKIITEGSGTQFDAVLIDAFKSLRKEFAEIHEGL